MNMARAKLQPPFRQRDLRSLSDFIRYCRDRGVDTSEKQLEYYEKEGLLLPAVRINRGFVEYRKVLVEHEGKLDWGFVSKARIDRRKYKDIDRLTYYGYGSIVRDGNDWLDEYKRRGLVEYPAEAEFREWTVYKGIWPRRSSYFTEKPLPEYETFYSKYQMFPLKQIQGGLRIIVMDQALFVNDAEWADIGKIRRMFVAAPEVLQKVVLRYYEILSLLNGVLTLLDQMERSGQATYESSLEDWDKETEIGKRSEASRDAWATVALEKSKKTHGEAKVLLAKSGLSTDAVVERREEFAILGYQADPIQPLFQHMKHIPRGERDRVSGAYRFACECYDIADQLGWFLELLGQKQTSLEEMLPGLSRYSVCPYCRRYFVPGRRNQQTCGANDCVKAHKNSWKREMRKKGLIK